MTFPRVAGLKTYEQFTSHLQQLELELPCDRTLNSGLESELAQPLNIDGVQIGNRFCILPMEGWDGTAEGKPTELTRRRWRNFGRSGAGLIWGGEAVAVRQDGRANPNQLLINDGTLSDVAELRQELVASHEAVFGSGSELLVGLQLTHSGRYARPNQKDRAEPRTVQRNPALDRRMKIEDDSALLSDDDLATLVDDFVDAAIRAEKAGFQFVDVKHCHGYLGHELLGGYDRPGKYGGSFENRTRFLRDVTQGIQSETGLQIGVRLSIFDFVPFCPGPDQRGIPDPLADPRLVFGSDATGLAIDLEEPSKFLRLLESLKIRLVCTTAGSPYYNPHLQRPASFPPSDGYQPPEDPLAGVARQVLATAELKRRHPELILIGSGYSYLQDWLPHVAQAVVRRGWVDFVGLGRMVLSYPELPADILSGKVMQRKKICRTFSDCTTAPRNGIISGCFPLDPFYKRRPEHAALKQAKQNLKAKLK